MIEEAYFQSNPFTPGFGQVPPFLAGREYMVRDVSIALRSNHHDPNHTTLYVGARGSGKTTLLNLVASDAISCGWICAQVSAIPGMLDDILVSSQRSLRLLLGEKNSTQLTSIGMAGVSLAWEHTHTELTNWRSRINDLLDALEPLGSGLLITVDEAQSGFDELVQLASVYQHLVGEQRRVALLMAGLPYQVSRILNDKSISFLRRAVRHSLGRIDDLAIFDALENTVLSAGRTIDSEALSLAVDAIDGSPYMMQLVGYRMWGIRPDSPSISVDDVRRGTRQATIELRERVLETTWDELSQGDIRFLSAMLEDEQNSKMSDVANRLGVSVGYAAQYRRRLMERGVIGPRSRGVVGFDLPGWREFMLSRLDQA